MVRKASFLPLVIVEMALAVVLLIGAGVMIRSFLNVYSAPLGFRPENILTALISLPKARYSQTKAQTLFYDRLRSASQSHAWREIDGDSFRAAGPERVGGSPMKLRRHRLQRSPRAMSLADRRSQRWSVSPGLLRNAGRCSLVWAGFRSCGMNLRMLLRQS